MIDFILTLPELYLIFSICIIFFYNIVYSHNSSLGYPILTTQNTILTLIIFFNLIILGFNHHLNDASILNNLFIKDYFTLTLENLLFVFGFLFFALTKDYLTRHFNSYEIILIFLIAFLGLACLILSNHMFSMYLSLEVQSICFYVLVASNLKNLQSIESSLKYFILGSFSSAILLFGISYIYGYTGLVFFEDLGKFCMSYPLIEVVSIFSLGLILLFIGLFFKIYAAPFHFWISDIYQGSPYNVTMFFAIIPFISFFSVFVKLVYVVFFNYMYILHDIIYVISILSMLLGSIGALFQNQFKRLMAYSSVAHCGYFLVPFITLNLMTLQYVLIYIMLYTILLFIIFGIIINQVEQTRTLSMIKYSYINNINDFSKFSGKVYGIIMSLCLFSMIGVPPLGGFFVKLFFINSLLLDSEYILIFTIILSSLISSFYLLRIVKLMFFKYKTNKRALTIDRTLPESNLSLFVCLYLFLFSLLYSFFPDLLYDLTFLMVFNLIS